MNKNLIIAVVVGVVVLGGLGMFLMNQNQSKDISDNLTKESNKMMEKESSTGNDGTVMMEKSGKYIEFSNQAVEDNSSKRRVLFFYANWCPTCRPANANFASQTDQIPEDVTVIRVNYNDTETDEAEKALAKKYNVTYQHTFVQIDERGNELTKWNGGQMEELLKNLK